MHLEFVFYCKFIVSSSGWKEQGCCYAAHVGLVQNSCETQGTNLFYFYTDCKYFMFDTVKCSIS